MFEGRLGGALDAGTVAVYLPMSYQIGGYTLLLPRAYLTPVEMGMEEAMRFLITAGLSPVLDPERGWDHGVFVPLLLVRPQGLFGVVETRRV